MALSNIILADGQATPVNRTFEVFTPQVGSNAALLNQKSSGITAMADRLNLVTKRANSNSSYHVVLNLVVPREVDSITKKVERAHVEIKVVIPDGFNALMRSDLAAYTKNLLNHATIQTAIKDVVAFA